MDGGKREKGGRSQDKSEYEVKVGEIVKGELRHLPVVAS